MSLVRFDVDGVIFDLGSTLLEYETIPWDELHFLCTEAGYSFLKDRGLNPPDKELFWQKQVEIRNKYRIESAKTLKEWSLVDGLREVLEAVGIKTDERLARQFFAAFYEPIARQLTMFADAPTVLDELKSRGKKIGLISNTIFPEEYHLREMKFYRILHYFDFTIFSVTHGYRKPYKSIYELAIRKMELPPERIVMVGDRYIEDVKGPSDCGLKAILKFREGREYPDPFPEDIIVVNSLTELLKYIVD